MTGQGVTVLQSYQYDPLDRIAGCVSLSQGSTQRIYRNDRLTTEIQGQKQFSFFEHGTHVLAQQQREAGTAFCALLAADLPGTVIHSLAGGQRQSLTYSPYGHRYPESGLISLLGFNGERRDATTGHYLLGKGYRAFNPVLMRFNSPDSLSPFGRGGINAYVFCEGDPINWVDPDGQSPILASYFKYRMRAAGVTPRNLPGNAASTLPSSTKTLGSTALKRPVAQVSNPKSMQGSQIEALDLALPETRDQGKLRHAGAEHAEAQRVLDSAQKQYSVLERFAASPPRKNDGSFEVENFNPSDIVNQRDYKRLEFAQRRVVNARAALEHVTKEYFARYPRGLNDYIAGIRSSERRGSF